MPNDYGAIRRQSWTRRQVLALVEIEAKHGPLTYQWPGNIEEIFFDLTGVWRSSGTIYFGYDRYRHGKYDALLNGTIPLTTSAQVRLDFTLT